MSGDDSTECIMSLKALRDKRTKLVTQMRGMHTTAEADGGRDFTAEEIAAYDGLEAELKAIDANIGRLVNLEAAEAAGTVVVPAASRGAGIGSGGRGPEAKKEFESLGEFMNAVRFNPNDQRLNFVEGAGATGADGEMSAAMRMDDQTSGGFMIPPQLRETIMSVPAQDALVRPRAQVIPAGSPPDAGLTIPALDQTGSNPGNVFGGIQVSWIEEGGEKPETDAKLRNVTLTPHEVAGFVTVTDKFLRNWPAASSFLEGLLRGGVSQAEDYAFRRGTGVNQPLGMLNAEATYFVHRTTANHVVYDDLVQMVAHLLMRGGASPIWSMPQAALPDIAKMTDPEGHYIWQPNARDGFAGQLLGYPVRWDNRSPGLGTKGDVALADWSQYLIKDGSGPFVATSEHVKFTSNQTLIKIFWNVDGQPWLTEPFVEENGYEVSSFVALDVPA
jgi:HK97 family phage major capsid protein